VRSADLEILFDVNPIDAVEDQTIAGDELRRSSVGA